MVSQNRQRRLGVKEIVPVVGSRLPLAYRTKIDRIQERDNFKERVALARDRILNRNRELRQPVAEQSKARDQESEHMKTERVKKLEEFRRDKQEIRAKKLTEKRPFVVGKSVNPVQGFFGQADTKTPCKRENMHQKAAEAAVEARRQSIYLKNMTVGSNVSNKSMIPTKNRVAGPRQGQLHTTQRHPPDQRPQLMPPNAGSMNESGSTAVQPKNLPSEDPNGNAEVQNEKYEVNALQARPAAEEPKQDETLDIIALKKDGTFEIVIANDQPIHQERDHERENIQPDTELTPVASNANDLNNAIELSAEGTLTVEFEPSATSSPRRDKASTPDRENNWYNGINPTLTFQIDIGITLANEPPVENRNLENNDEPIINCGEASNAHDQASNIQVDVIEPYATVPDSEDDNDGQNDVIESYFMAADVEDREDESVQEKSPTISDAPVATDSALRRSTRSTRFQGSFKEAGAVTPRRSRSATRRSTVPKMEPIKMPPTPLNWIDAFGDEKGIMDVSTPSLASFSSTPRPPSSPIWLTKSMANLDLSAAAKPEQQTGASCVQLDSSPESENTTYYTATSNQFTPGRRRSMTAPSLNTTYDKSPPTTPASILRRPGIGLSKERSLSNQ